MSRFDIRKRDGLARTGTFQTDSATFKVPSAQEMETIFPDLAGLHHANIPLAAPAALVNEYPPAADRKPVTLHPHLAPVAVSGDCVMVPNWHTAFANPRTYVEWLVGLKEKTVPDAAGMPRPVHSLRMSTSSVTRVLISSILSQLISGRPRENSARPNANFRPTRWRAASVPVKGAKAGT